uniref:Uncharacterized protein n=1 Tax=Cacopsylla melanoneura TaxID=428564 RepID=A0A8D8QHE9_9HEMI
MSTDTRRGFHGFGVYLIPKFEKGKKPDGSKEEKSLNQTQKSIGFLLEVFQCNFEPYSKLKHVCFKQKTCGVFLLRACSFRLIRYENIEFQSTYTPLPFSDNKGRRGDGGKSSVWGMKKQHR